MGPTQHWPDPSPRIRRRQKVINPEANSSEIKEPEVENVPIDNEINEDADRVSVPYESREMLDELESGKNDGSPAKSKEGLAGDEIDKSTECNKESMHKLNHLAQVCCDKEGLNYENLSFSRRVTRSMHNLHLTPGYRSDQ